MPKLIIQQSCFSTLLPRLKGQVDLVVTSPPYNASKPYGGDSKNDRMKWPDYYTMTEDYANLVKASLSPGGSFFLNIGSHKDQVDLPYRVMAIMLAAGLKLQNTFVWVKSISMNNQSRFDLEFDAYGHYTPINSEIYVNQMFEHVFHFSLEGKAKLDRLAIGVPYKDKSNTERWGSEGAKADCRCRGNVWYIPYATIQKERDHPAPFPLQIPLWAAKMTHPKVTLDPFTGSGTSAQAAIICGVDTFYGCDKYTSNDSWNELKRDAIRANYSV